MNNTENDSQIYTEEEVHINFDTESTESTESTDLESVIMHDLSEHDLSEHDLSEHDLPEHDLPEHYLHDHDTDIPSYIVSDDKTLPITEYNTDSVSESDTDTDTDIDTSSPASADLFHTSSMHDEYEDPYSVWKPAQPLGAPDWITLAMYGIGGGIIIYSLYKIFQNKQLPKQTIYTMETICW